MLKGPLADCSVNPLPPVGVNSPVTSGAPSATLYLSVLVFYEVLTLT